MAPQGRITLAFGQAVKHFRCLNNLSQEELAERAGLHRTYIGDVERGRRNITLVNAEKLANALSLDLADLVGYSNDN